jgi:phosphoribosylformylglycinamidine synthase subunit PurL
VRRGVRSGALRSAHDVAEGGLAVALAECCIAGGRGAAIDFGAPADEALLFGEGPGAFVVSGPRDALARFGAAAKFLGTIGGDALRIEGVLDVAVADLARAHAGGLADLLH